MHVSLDSSKLQNIQRQLFVHLLMIVIYRELFSVSRMKDDPNINEHSAWHQVIAKLNSDLIEC